MTGERGNILILFYMLDDWEHRIERVETVKQATIMVEHWKQEYPNYKAIIARVIRSEEHLEEERKP